MAKTKPLVSIIIPAHNEERYIGKTLLYVRRQTYKNIEIIVVNDGSSDKTAKIAKRYADRVIRMERRGVSSARNKGAKEARGRLFIFLDADTILYDKNLIKKILSHINRGYYHGTCRMKPENPKSLNHLLYSHAKNFFIKHTPLRACNGVIFIRKEVHQKIGGFNEKKDKEEIFEYFRKADNHGNFKFVEAEVITSMRRGTIKTLLYWIGIRTGLLRKKPYPVIR